MFLFQSGNFFYGLVVKFCNFQLEGIFFFLLGLK